MHHLDGSATHVYLELLVRYNSIAMISVAVCCSSIAVCVAVSSRCSRAIGLVDLAYCTSVVPAVARRHLCFAVCCSVLQCVAVCCSVLQCSPGCHASVSVIKNNAGFRPATVNNSIFAEFRPIRLNMCHWDPRGCRR